MLRLRRQQPQRREHQQRADRSVDKEDRTPAEPGQIERHQPAADDETDGPAEPERNPENRKRAAAAFVGEQAVDRGEHLRHHQRGGEALGETRQDQRSSGRRETAGKRRCDKTDEPDQEQAPRPIHVAEPAAGDDHRRISDLIDRDHALDLRRAGVEIGADRRDCDVHNERVDHIHELRGNDHREDKPAARIDGAERCLFHDTTPRFDHGDMLGG
jgi:hypothetical protein